MGHGDGLGPKDNGYKLIKKIFTNNLAQRAFRTLHPDLGISLGQYFSLRNKLNSSKKKSTFIGEDNEKLATYARQKLKQKYFDFFIFGHNHLPSEISLDSKSKYINLGDWISHFTYASFDGIKLELKNLKSNNMIDGKSISHEKTILVGLINSSQTIEQVKEYLDELEFLTFTAGGKVHKRFVQKFTLLIQKHL